MPLKWLGDKIKKGVRDISSGAKDIVGNNPEMLAVLGAMYGIPYLKSKGLGVPGGWDILGNKGIISNVIGSLGTQGSGSGPDEIFGQKGEGVLGTLQNIAGGLFGKDGGSKGISGILALLVKNELEKEKARALEGDRSGMFDVASEKFGGEFGIGANPKKEWVFEGLQYDPETGKRYDKYDNGFEDYITDSDDRITNYAKDGGIAQLKMGGTGNPMPMPFNPNNKISGILTSSEPILQRAYGGGTETPLFDPRMSGNQMMNQIKQNPGITDFFPPQFGHIRGPGGPKDDKIPAMLSDGEFVMTAKAVDNAGGPEAMYKMMNKLDPDSSKGKGII
jgi:hypothetical protein